MGPLVTFLTITYGVKWTFFLAALAFSHGMAPSNQALAMVPGLLVFVGTMAPGLVAIAITARIGGTPTIRCPWRN